jgi:hypothetical protein
VGLRHALRVQIWSEHVRGCGADCFVVGFCLEFSESEKWVFVSSINYLLEYFFGPLIASTDRATSRIPRDSRLQTLQKKKDYYS